MRLINRRKKIEGGKMGKREGQKVRARQAERVGKMSIEQRAKDK